MSVHTERFMVLLSAVSKVELFLGIKGLVMQ